MYTLKDFKGFESVSVDLSRPFTLLIGPNGIGKSNLIEGVELLSYLGSGVPLHAVTDVGRGGGFEIRGGIQSCARRPGTEFTLGLHEFERFERRSVDVDYQLTVRTRPTLEIRSEHLIVDGRKWFSAEPEHPGLLLVTYENFARSGHKPVTSVTAARTVLSRYREIAVKNKKLSACEEFVTEFRGRPSQSNVFDPIPRTMRSYARIGDDVLRRDGSNLSSVLYALSIGNDEQRAALHRISDQIRQLPEEPFGEIVFETTKLGDVIFGFATEDSQRLLDARLLSDGTLRALAVLTALETMDPDSGIIVEEVDNGLHPSRVATILASIAEVAARQMLHVLVTTHSPAVLDSLNAKQLAGVLVCHWNAARHAAEVTPLLELPRIDEMLATGRLGDLVTRRVLETHLVPVSDEERRAEVERWLAALP